MNPFSGNRKVAKLFGSAVLNQALLSAGNFVVGLILIRLTADSEYGAYVLLMSTIMLLGPLQVAFITPGMTIRLTHSDRSERTALIGGLYRGHRRALLIVTCVGVMSVLLLGFMHVLTLARSGFYAAAIVATAASLYREFFRMVLMSYHRPFDVLKGDVLYVFLLVAGAVVSVTTRVPAMVAAATLAFAALCGGAVVSGYLWRHEPWDLPGRSSAFRQVAPSGAWAAIGCGIHWSFTQGYSYLVAAVMNVGAVAGINATRLTLVPVGLLSSGVSTMMFPVAHMWLKDRGPQALMRRLIGVAGVMTLLTLGYAAVIWVLRDWIFLEVFKKPFFDRDRLFLMWVVVFALVSIRDEVIFLLIVRERFKLLAGLALICAIIALTSATVLIRQYGVIGALIGMSIGEGTNLLGVILLSIWELHRQVLPPITVEAPV